MQRAVKVLVVGVLLSGALAVPAAAATGFPYTFNSDDQGWETTQGKGAFAAAAWSGSAGNPGGAISVADTDSSAFDGFFSPVAGEGDYGSNFGGTLSFDVKSSVPWGEGISAALVGSANGEAEFCMFDDSVVPEANYQTAQFTLDGAGVYKLDLNTGECSVHPTDAEVSEALSTFVEIVISGEDEEASGTTTTIDNVTLTGGAPIATPQLTVLRAGTGSGTVTSSPAGISCGSTCSASFVEGTPVTLAAAAAPGSTFAGWSGAGCSGAGSCQVMMSAAHEVTALFNVSAPENGGEKKTVKPLKCKKGFKKKQVHGKARCVKVKKKHHRHH